MAGQREVHRHSRAKTYINHRNNVGIWQRFFKSGRADQSRPLESPCQRRVRSAYSALAKNVSRFQASRWHPFRDDRRPFSPFALSLEKHPMAPRPMSTRSRARKRSRVRSRTKKKDPIFVDGHRPRPMYVDYKDVELLRKMINRQGRIVGRRKSGCSAASQHAVSAAVKRARYMALLPFVGE